MRSLSVLFLFLSIVISCCKKYNTPECIIPAIVPFQPYSFPVWHPNGQQIGFNHTPLAGIGSNGNAPCIWYSYVGKSDSTGFYIMNKNGTGLKRITNYNLFAPAWSPDGNWIAFSLGSNIYKMRYTGSGFDTANIIQLTNGRGNFHPSWTANSDTIYYDSNNTLPDGTSFYTIWKMASDGTSKERIVDATTVGDIRFPFVGNDGKIYHTRYISSQPEIFSMNKDGSSQQQITSNGQTGNRNSPKFFQGSLFYNDNSTIRKLDSNGLDIKFVSPSVTYDISSTGEIVYSKMDYSITTYNKQIGTLWIINADGTYNRQLTFNNF